MSDLEAKKKLDISVVAFLLPYLTTAAYGIYVYITVGSSSVQDKNVVAFLTITKNPYLFFLDSALTLLALILFVTAFEGARRVVAIENASRILVFLGIFSSVSAYIMAAYSSGELIEAVGLMTEGRFASIYPFILFFTSYLLRLELPTSLTRTFMKWLIPVLPLVSIPLYYILLIYQGLDVVTFFTGIFFLVALVVTAEVLYRKK